MGQSSFFRWIKKILSPEKTVFFMRGNRFFRCFCLKESSLTAEKNFFLWGLLFFFARKNLFLLCLGSYVREGESWGMGRKFCVKKSSFTVKKGRRGWRERQAISMLFLCERNFVCRKWLYILRISKDREEQKESRDFVRKKLLFVRKAEAFVNDE